MNIKVLFLCGLSLALISCTSMDPEYAEWKKEKEQKAASEAALGGGDPYSNISNPYGVPSNTPQGGSEVGQYSANTPNPGTPPYQPLPGVPSTPPGQFPTIPSAGTPSYGSTAAGNLSPATVQTHVVSKGDSLWGLSRKYNTSIDSIRQANGLSSDTIRVGQTLQIPR